MQASNTATAILHNRDDHMRDHRRLKAFQLADTLALAIYAATKSFPREELFGLVSQLRRAAVSIAANIVEGCARQTQREYERFLDISLSSSRETEYLLSLAARLNYLDGQEAGALAEQCDHTSRVLASLINSLKRSE